MIVYDQIETSPYDAYTGSYGSNVFLGHSSIFTTGSFLRQVIGDSATLFTNTGALVGKKYLLSDYPTIYRVLNNRNINRVGFTKFSVGVCREEQYSDSVIGHPLGYSSINGISASVVVPQGFAYNDTDAHIVLGVPAIAPISSVMLFVGTSSCVIGMDNGLEEQFCDNVWNYTGPFQSRYKGIQRLQTPSFRAPTAGKSTVSRSFIANEALRRNTLNFTASYDSISILCFVTRSGAANATPTQQTIFVDGAVSGVSTTNLVADFVPSPGFSSPLITTKTLYNAYFGFGDGPHHFPKGFHEVGLAASITYQFNYVPEIRGWKYGLFDSHPRFSVAIWRYGRFGQFRDLLEQRPFTKFYTDNTFLGAPVRVSFTTASTAFVLAQDYVTATNPTYDPRDSGIYDYEYRSGQPFIDIEPTD